MPLDTEQAPRLLTETSGGSIFTQPLSVPLGSFKRCRKKWTPHRPLANINHFPSSQYNLTETLHWRDLLLLRLLIAALIDYPMRRTVAELPSTDCLGVYLGGLCLLDELTLGIKRYYHFEIMLAVTRKPLEPTDAASV